MSTKNTNNKGKIEVICGSMFSGKTKMLIKKIKEAKSKNNKVSVFKPKIDVRYNPEKIVSHEKDEISAIPVNNSKDIIDLAKKSSFVAIDEAQFFDLGIVNACVQLAENNTQVVLAGLDMDFLGKPFGPMPNLMAIANQTITLHANCDICNEKAHHTYRASKNNDTIMLGEKGEYLALCKKCFLNKTKNDE